MTKLPNNKDPSEDKSEQSRDIVDKAGEIGADEDRSSVYDLTELLAKARAPKEARSLMLDQDDIDVLHQRLDSIDRKITFLGEIGIAVLAVIAWVAKNSQTLFLLNHSRASPSPLGRLSVSSAIS